jgi:hypothetical protein
MPMPMAPSVYTRAHQDHASPKKPMPAALQAYQLRIFRAGLESIERGQAPTVDDWRVCSDVVNLLESLKGMGEIADEDGLLPDAIAALAESGQRHLQGKAIRLTATGLQAVRATIEGYAFALEHLPHRTIIKAHRQTAQRIQRLLKTAPQGVSVMSL